jgi:hypothetical protein
MNAYPSYRRQGMSDHKELSGEKMYKLPGGEIVPVISLRDYFAAAAVTGFIASEPYPEERKKGMASGGLFDSRRHACG